VGAGAVEGEGFSTVQQHMHCLNLVLSKQHRVGLSCALCCTLVVIDRIVIESDVSSCLRNQFSRRSISMSALPH
jgi:hypothetical protein